MTQPAGWEEFGLPLKLNVQRAELTEEQFMRLCQENPELRIELRYGERGQGRDDVEVVLWLQKRLERCTGKICRVAAASYFSGTSRPCHGG